MRRSTYAAQKRGTNAASSSQGMIAWLSFKEHITIFAGPNVFYESFHYVMIKAGLLDETLTEETRCQDQSETPLYQHLIKLSQH